jgi:hypothetical protein
MIGDRLRDGQCCHLALRYKNTSQSPISSYPGIFVCSSGRSKFSRRRCCVGRHRMGVPNAYPHIRRSIGRQVHAQKNPTLSARYTLNISRKSNIIRRWYPWVNGSYGTSVTTINECMQPPRLGLLTAIAIRRTVSVRNGRPRGQQTAGDVQCACLPTVAVQGKPLRFDSIVHCCSRCARPPKPQASALTLQYIDHCRLDSHGKLQDGFDRAHFSA